MLVFLARNHSVSEQDHFCIYKGPPQYICYRLQSYFDLYGFGKTWKLKMKNKNKVSIFLDSGAFSAFTKGVTIDIDEYIAFIKQHKKYLDVYSVLDVIGDAEATYQNQLYMESKGVSPLPCFHYGEDVKYLKRYVEKYSYIAFGGMVPISTPRLVDWLDKLFSNFICDSDGFPKVKVHGFGMTSFRLMRRYPWYSVDSTSWIHAGAFGSVYVPRLENGKYIYSKDPWKIIVSDSSPKKKDEGSYHIDTLSNFNRQEIEKYFEHKGFVLGSCGSESPGLCNSHVERDKANITYFLDFQNSLPKFPWSFKTKNKMKRFGR